MQLLLCYMLCCLLAIYVHCKMSNGDLASAQERIQSPWLNLTTRSGDGPVGSKRPLQLEIKASGTGKVLDSLPRGGVWTVLW